jgi:hypothetical protein
MVLTSNLQNLGDGCFSFRANQCAGRKRGCRGGRRFAEKLGEAEASLSAGVGFTEAKASASLRIDMDD